MKTTNTSLFNLIEIFRSNNPKLQTMELSELHCEQKQLHDYYCDAEKPFVFPN